MKAQNALKYSKKRIKDGPVTFAVMMVFLAFFIASGIYFAVIGQGRNSSMSFAFILIIPAFYLFERLLNVRVSAVYAIILMLFSCGTIMGACYEVYTYVPVFDTILHGLWGVVFSVMGMTIITPILGEPKTHKTFFAVLLFGFMFCLATGLLWELFEYAGTYFGGYDMEEDQLVTSIRSYFLSGNHYETYNIDGIVKTVLYDAEGNILYTINGGYLELGLIDTIIDMAFCFIFGAIFFGVMVTDHFIGKRLYKWLVPKYLKDAPQTEEQEEVEAEAEAAAADTQTVETLEETDTD